jgi:hypothetical protein
VTETAKLCHDTVKTATETVGALKYYFFVLILTLSCQYYLLAHLESERLPRFFAFV